MTMDPHTPDHSVIDRRAWLKKMARGGCLLGLGALSWRALGGAGSDQQVWQIDPNKCISCGNCATYCVLKESAVKCVHNHEMCGYCNLCTGYYKAEPDELDTAAENQMCPTGAIRRRFVEKPYFEYNIDEQLCIGCGKCVKGCNAFGNGSLFLQVRHNRCLNCNQCAIAESCPADAFRRVPASTAYLLKGFEETP